MLVELEFHMNNQYLQIVITFQILPRTYNVLYNYIACNTNICCLCEIRVLLGILDFIWQFSLQRNLSSVSPARLCVPGRMGLFLWGFLMTPGPWQIAHVQKYLTKQIMGLGLELMLPKDPFCLI